MSIRRAVASSVGPAALLLACAALAGCHHDAPDATAANAANVATPAGESNGQTTQSAAADASNSLATAAPDAPPPPASTGFQPLASQKVKDAIHAALSTGTTQRWADGDYSGYAVPGAAGANGCRQVRYTVDQRPSQVEQITACDASRQP